MCEVHTDGESAAFICAPAPLEYAAMVKGRGCRNWRTVGDYKTKAEAAQAMLDAFLAHRNVKRAIVLAIYAWYDPIRLMEITR